MPRTKSTRGRTESSEGRAADDFWTLIRTPGFMTDVFNARYNPEVTAEILDDPKWSFLRTLDWKCRIARSKKSLEYVADLTMFKTDGTDTGFVFAYPGREIVRKIAEIVEAQASVHDLHIDLSVHDLYIDLSVHGISRDSTWLEETQEGDAARAKLQERTLGAILNSIRPGDWDVLAYGPPGRISQRLPEQGKLSHKISVSAGNCSLVTHKPINNVVEYSFAPFFVSLFHTRKLKVVVSTYTMGFADEPKPGEQSTVHMYTPQRHESICQAVHGIVTEVRQRSLSQGGGNYRWDGTESQLVEALNSIMRGTESARSALAQLSNEDKARFKRNWWKCGDLDVRVEYVDQLDAGPRYGLSGNRADTSINFDWHSEPPDHGFTFTVALKREMSRLRGDGDERMVLTRRALSNLAHDIAHELGTIGTAYPNHETADPESLKLFLHQVQQHGASLVTIMCRSGGWPLTQVQSTEAKTPDPIECQLGWPNSRLIVRLKD